jgi:hypothetical protein
LKAEDIQSFKDVIQAHQLQDSFSATVYKQFKELKSDYDGGKINLARYTDYLKPLQEFLKENAVLKSKELNRDEIQQEISKYL